ncbi:hypothetical protein V6N13_001868 [Hibiscus sabdariffa]
MLLLCRRLRQGISNVVICVYLSYFHISSDEMEVAKNMIGSLMRSRFLCLHNGSIVITTEFLASDMLEITLGSDNGSVCKAKHKKKQQIKADRSCTKVVLDQRPRICPDSRETPVEADVEIESGVRSIHPIFLSITVQRACQLDDGKSS